MAVVESSGIEVDGGDIEQPALVLRSEIRGDAVSARWDGGSLTGDDELVRRVTNLAVWRQLDLADLEPAQVINLAREACAAPIETELLLPADEVLTDPVGGPTGLAASSTADLIRSARPSFSSAARSASRSPAATASSILAVAASTSAFTTASTVTPSALAMSARLSPASQAGAQLGLGQTQRVGRLGEVEEAEPVTVTAGTLTPGEAPVIREAVLHEAGDPLLEVGLRVGRRLVDGLLAGGHELVDERGLVDAFGLGDLGQRVAVIEPAAELVLAQTERVGGHREVERSEEAARTLAGVLPGAFSGVRCGGRGRRRAGATGRRSWWAHRAWRRRRRLR